MNSAPSSTGATTSTPPAMSRCSAAWLELRTPEAMHALFGTADLIVTPASVGEAPPGLSSTGDPRFNRLWTLLGCPTLSVPGRVGATGMPIGVQLVARPYHEALLIRGGQMLTASLGQQTQPSK